jgi:tetratricopeptide (TPR) repeat protein
MCAVATGNLGRAAARAGRADEAQELLTEALHSMRELKAASFVVETQVRLAEAAALASEPEAALAAADTAAELSDVPTPAVQALLHRVRAYAHLQLGNAAEAERALERSLEIARSSDALYELALSLQTRARLHGDVALAKEARGLLDALHVIAVRDPPPRT